MPSLGIGGAVPSLCAAIINSEKLLNHSIEKPKLYCHEQLKHGAQTRVCTMCATEEGIRSLHLVRGKSNMSGKGVLCKLHRPNRLDIFPLLLRDY